MGATTKLTAFTKWMTSLQFLLPYGNARQGMISRLVVFLSVCWSVLKIHWIGIKFTAVQITSRHKPFRVDDHRIVENTGRWAVITGGSRGIGLEVVRKLYACNMNVIIGCRDVDYGNQMVNRLRARHNSHQGHSLHVFHLDLMSFTSVKRFAQQVVDVTGCQIHALVNNAGVMFPTIELTEDGFGNQIQTNHLGHHLLIDQLIPALGHGGTRAKRARLINVSSVAHYGSPVDISHGILDNDDTYKLYMDSKFCQISASIGWNTVFDSNQLNIHATNVHPGIVNTALYQHVFYYKWMKPLMSRLYLTPAQGADCVVFAALSPEPKTPLFLVNSDEKPPHHKIHDLRVLQRIWTLSCQATGVTR